MQKSQIAIVFIHGAGLSSSIWNAVIPVPNSTSYHLNFLGRGDSDTVHQKFQDYEDDLISQMNQIKEPQIVLIGHSLGGIFMMRLSEVFKERVIGFVSMSAMIPKPGKNFFSCLPFPQRIIMPLIVKLAGTKVPESAIRTSLCKDLSESDTKSIVKNFTPESPSIYSTPINYPELKVPACYLIFTEDADFSPATQREMAQRIHAEVVEIKGGHLAMMSQAKAVSEVLSNFIHKL